MAVLLFPALAAPAACIPFTAAPEHVGESVCVTGKVLKVAEGKNGAWFLDLCDDHKTCPFTVVVFARDLRDVGDVRQLAGKQIQLFGKIKLYAGKAEIILKDARQLHGEAAKLPPMPREYDASRHGSYRAGRYRTKGKPADLDPEKR
ncbi:MAG: OB-fold nucleic acid binding domain-containing protein [Candidatus Koribacter versatilis]|uniref:OB-fold nucleic acid binding domain-containing protein n=1 Tax=Candidatus Korobacter versatilis TaxID=658062 RepID=A0A932EQH7_9BACT|nr:OB-fold nucleic acid binding domain-containing protein [Candidatus Koribacter versatilis]